MSAGLNKLGDKMFDEEKRLPDLPTRKRFFDDFDLDGEEKEEKHPLPAFPDTPGHNQFSQAAIKDAVGEEVDESDLPELPELPEEKEVRVANSKPKIVEMEEWKPEIPLGMSRIEPPEESIEVPRKEDFRSLRREIGSPDIFVKIDKFRNARKTFNEVKAKLNEIDDLIKRIRETKMREEQELSAWERDVQNIKSRVKDVSENIFEKVD